MKSVLLSSLKHDCVVREREMMIKDWLHFPKEIKSRKKKYLNPIASTNMFIAIDRQSRHIGEILPFVSVYSPSAV